MDFTAQAGKITLTSFPHIHRASWRYPVCLFLLKKSHIFFLHFTRITAIHQLLHIVKSLVQCVQQTYK